MTTYFGKSCSFGLPRLPFVNCRQFMYLVISLLVLRARCGIWLYQFLIIAYLFTSHRLIIPKYDVHTSNSLQDIRQNHLTMKYRSQEPTFILRPNVGPYWLIIPKYDVHTTNSLQDIRQNHWTMKYRSVNLHSFWGQTLGHTDSKSQSTSNSLQDVRQNKWTMKYRSQWPMFIFRSPSGHTDS